MADAFVGEIRILPYAGNRVPEGWLPCAGQAISIATYEVLYALLGTTYGGNGVTDFKVPDLRGRLPIGPGSYPIGASGGVELIALTAAQGYAHNHAFTATTETDTSNAPGPTLLMGSDPNYLHYATPSASPQYGALGSQAVSVSGGSMPHDNIMPSIGLQFVICYSGIFPTQA